MEKAECDPLLRPLLDAPAAPERERALLDLMERHAAPAMQRVLQGRLRASPGAVADLEDVTSAARAELLRRLQFLAEENEGASIANFRAYAGTVAYAAWAEHLRRIYPARSMLLNRLRYLLENRTNQRGFALWDDENGERWCGLARWRGLAPSAANLKTEQLIADPIAIAADALGRRDFKEMNPAELLAGLFRWVDQPIELRQLVKITAELWEISDFKQSLDTVSPNDSAFGQTDPAPSPIDALKWREYLAWLWRELGKLSVPQRTAFLLHSTVTREFEIAGLGSIRGVATLLERSAEEVARLWAEIPLPDLAIAQLLKRERQQVINLRRVARDHLGAAWRKWINATSH